MDDKQTIRQLTIENGELRSENADLRHRLRDASYHARRMEQAYRDALQLALWAVANIHPSRRFAAEHGITQARWENAVALLRQARIIEGLRHWATKDAGFIERRLEQTRQVAVESRERYRARHVRDKRL